MHEPVRGRLEEILQNRLSPAQKQEVRAHLKACAACASELREIGLTSGLVRTLRPAEVPDPSAGFYARVMQRVEAQGRPSFWNLLLDPVFGRRLLYGTGAMFLLMASFLLATTGGQAELAQTPVQMMVQPTAASESSPQSNFGDDMQQDREQFLVTMASFAD